MNVTVGSKRFLTNKVDRSVTGLIAQQQCVGPLHTPLSNFGLFAQSYYKYNGYYRGCATSIGTQPIVGLLDPKALVQKSVAEMLTNLVWVVIEKFENIRCSANWMWAIPNKDAREGYKMYSAVKELNSVLIQLQIAIDGGKDSLSMAVNHNDKLVKSPGTLVLSSYVDCPDVYKKVSPDLKSNCSTLLFVDLSEGNMSMGGSMAQQYSNCCGRPPYIRNMDKLKQMFLLIQELIKNDMILSGHDKSDGGLIVTLLEMAFAGNVGLEINIPDFVQHDDIIKFLFNEEIGVVIECVSSNVSTILEIFSKKNIDVYPIAETCSGNKAIITHNKQTIFENTMTSVRETWEFCSYDLEKDQCNKDCVEAEKEIYGKMDIPTYKLALLDTLVIPERQYWVGILREEGTNSERELAAAFYQAGFNVIDINTHDLINGNITLEKLNGIGFAGGFSFSDVLGSAKGWYNVIQHNQKIKKQFDDFYARDDTFSIGICNGCQLMGHLGWVKAKLLKNTSGRFESRFSTVRVTNSDNIFLKGLDDLVFGIWVAHGEGRFDNIEIERENICVRYTDFQGIPTEQYPHNPNGSYKGTAAVSSSNHRHLAIMPHPERTFLKWQIPWSNIKLENDYSPWFRLFVNARKWCDTNQKIIK